MTDKMSCALKCPWCGQTLKKHEWELNIWQWVCDNPGCYETRRLYGSYELWQALIDSKKAQDALNRIERILLLDSEKPMTLTPAGKKEIKEIITSITKGDKE